MIWSIWLKWARRTMAALAAGWLLLVFRALLGRRGSSYAYARVPVQRDLPEPH